MLNEIVLNQILQLFLIAEPLGVLPLFLIIVNNECKNTMRKQTYQLSILTGVLFMTTLSFAYLFGNFIINSLGINENIFKFISAIILLKVSLEMIFKKPEDMIINEGSKFKKVLLPIIFPLLAGPSAIFYIVANSISKNANMFYDLSAISFVGIIITILFALSYQLTKIIKNNGLMLFAKLSGVATLYISVIMLYEVISQYV